MKTKSLFLAALVMVAAVSAFGKEEPTNKGLAVVALKGTEVFKVIYKGETTGRVKLNVYNSASQLVFTESFAGVEGFILPLNFKGLSSGEYTVELVDANGAKIEKVSYQAGATSKTIKNLHISKLTDGNGRYLLAMASNGSKEIAVRIYDGDHNLIHSETKTVTGDFAQLYSVKEAKGGVTFEVTDLDGNQKSVSF